MWYCEEHNTCTRGTARNTHTCIRDTVRNTTRVHVVLRETRHVHTWYCEEYDTCTRDTEKHDTCTLDTASNTTRANTVLRGTQHVYTWYCEEHNTCTYDMWGTQHVHIWYCEEHNTCTCDTVRNTTRAHTILRGTQHVWITLRPPLAFMTVTFTPPSWKPGWQCSAKSSKFQLRCMTSHLPTN